MVVESPRTATVNSESFGSIFKTARSVFVSLPTNVAAYSSPVFKITVISSAPLITCSLVTIYPLELIMIPEPEPCSTVFPSAEGSE